MKKLVRKIDIDNNIIDLKKFYKVDVKNKGLINLMDKKDEQILEIEKLIEENYKINEITCGIDYSNNILIWNCRGVYINNKLNYISDKILTYQPLVLFLIDSKKNVDFFGYNSFYDSQNVILTRQGYEIKLERFYLKEKGNNIHCGWRWGKLSFTYHKYLSNWMNKHKEYSFYREPSKNLGLIIHNNNRSIDTEVQSFIAPSEH